MPKISFLILTYNSEKHIDEFLNSLFEKFGQELVSNKYELIIVDNASSDSTISVIQKNVNFKNLNLFENLKNLGYAGGINFAAKKANGDFLVIINPDSIILGGDFEKVTELFLERDKLAIAGLSIKSARGGYEASCGNFFNLLTLTLYCLGLERLTGLRFAPKDVKKVDFVSGGFVFIRKSTFEQLNGFDEDYFMYIEDMDLCYRAYKKGYEVYFMPYVSIQHIGQGSSNREFAILNIYKGLLTFYQKHSSFTYLQFVKNLLSLKAALIIFVSALLGKKEMLSTYSKALRAIK